MLNGQFLNKQAALFAQRLKQDPAGDLAQQCGWPCTGRRSGNRAPRSQRGVG